MASDALVLSDIDAYYGDSHVLQKVSLRLGEGRMRFRLVAAALLAVLYGAGGGLPGLVLAAIVAAILGGVCAAEAGISPWAARPEATIVSAQTKPDNEPAASGGKSG